MHENISQAIAEIRKHTDLVPEIALVLGSGLGALAEHIEGVAIPYGDIPHFPVSTAPSHKGELILGTLLGRRVVVMRGRVHMYEGYSPQQLTFPIRVMAGLGAQVGVLTNAAGGMGEGMEVGDLVAIEDHLSLPAACGFDPLRGENDSRLGPRFVSLNQAYDPALIALAQKLAPGVARGVYAHVAGPSFEPPALIRLLKAAGCDLVGMSTAPEVIVLRHMGVRCFALSAVTNIAVSSTTDPHITNEEEVWEAVKIIEPKLLAFMKRFLPAI